MVSFLGFAGRETKIKGIIKKREKIYNERKQIIHKYFDLIQNMITLIEQSLVYYNIK